MMRAISRWLGETIRHLQLRFSGRSVEVTERSRAAIGREGERLAVRCLKKQGFRIVARNFRAAGAEIDLVAMDHGTLVFVEVKRRIGTSAGTPQEAVDQHKQERIRRAAAVFTSRYRAESHPTRFDVVAISGAGRPQVEHLRDTF
jgi:putative endonuclease